MIDIYNEPWNIEFDSHGGYDCMTSAYWIKCKNVLICEIDTSGYHYKYGDEYNPHGESDGAKRLAQHIVDAHNESLVK